MASALCKKSVFSGRVRLQASRRAVAVNAASRPMWLPGLDAPAHLDGTLAGDYGFDPLNLGKDPKALLWYQQAELIHGRTAMAAVAGILIPGALTKAGALNVPEWYEAGSVSMKDSFTNFGTLVVVMHLMYGWAEGKRWMDIRKPGSQAEKGTFLGFESNFAGTGEVGYPGGPFDIFGLAKNKENFAIMKQREIKNGRLAMLAFLGFVAQHSATGKGPIDNLVEHVKDPLHTTFADNGVSVPFY